MVRQQQDKAPHRRLDDMRRDEDRRMAEREQVTNHSHRTAAGRPIAAERGCSTQHSSGPGMSVEWLPWQQALKRCVCVGEPCAALHSIQFKLTETQKTNQHELVNSVPQDTLFKTTSHVHASHHTSFSCPALNNCIRNTFLGVTGTTCKHSLRAILRL